MVAIIISEKGGPQRRDAYDKSEITIGRVQGNDLVLAKGNVSKRHAQIVVKDGKTIIVDLQSTNGTYVNGRKIQSPHVLRPSDKIYIGDFIISLDAPEGAAEEPESSYAPPGELGGELGPPPPPLGAGGALPPPAPPIPGRGRIGVPPSPDPGLYAPEPGSPSPFGDPGALFPELSGPAYGEAASEAGGGLMDLSFDEPPAAEAGPDRAATHSPPGGRDGLLPPPPPLGAGPSAPPVLPGGPAVQVTQPMQPLGPASGPSSFAAAGPVTPPHLPAAPPSGPAPVPPARSVPSSPAAPPAEPRPGRPAPPPRLRALGPLPSRPPEGPLGKELEERRTVLRALLQRLEPVLAGLEAEGLSWEAFRERTERAAIELLGEVESRTRLPANLRRDEIIQDAVDEATALGPLEELLQDETVREVMVNDPLHIYVSHGGELERQRKVFSDEAGLLAVIQRLLLDTGATLDATSPGVDVRRKDGIRVTALLPPLAVRGPVLTLRRSQLEPLAMDDLVANETVSPAMVELLEACVRGGKNILVAGGSGSGKTTLLNCLGAEIDGSERIVTIEDTCELVLPQENVVSLAVQPAAPGQPGLGHGDLINLALRLHPDRLIVGDLTGEDALELLRAMNSGCGGVLSSVHASDAQGALERLETMCLMSGREMPVRTLRELIATGVDLLVVLTRFPGGERRMTSILEVAGLDVDLVNLEEIFRFEVEGTDRDGAVLGHFRATGFMPRLYDDLQRRGLAPSPDIFR